jgi:hypothetical protein
MRQQIQLQGTWKELNHRNTFNLTAKPVNSADGEALSLQHWVNCASQLIDINYQKP